MEKRKEKTNVERNVLDALLKGKTSRKGIAIKDCRNKEVMVVTRYGGDVLLSFFDIDGTEPKFVCVFEMDENNPKNWAKIFLRFVEIKNLLRQD